MQKKHLHRLLLILALTGCGDSQYSDVNPYLSDKNAVALSFARGASHAVMIFGQADFAPAPKSTAPEPFVFRVHPHTGGSWIGGVHVDGFDRDAVRVSRTLNSLVLEDTTSGLQYVATALPSGEGIAFYLEGEAYSSVQFSLSHTLKDTLFLSGFKAGDRESYQLEDSTYFALAAAPDFTDDFKGHGFGFELRHELGEGRRRQVVVAFSDDAERAREVAHLYRGMTRKKLEQAVRDSLAAQLAFSLHTGDERTNEAFALLAAALANSGTRVSTSTPSETEEGASMARALFLASREAPRTATSTEATSLSHRIRWGSEAYRAALEYGAIDEDALKTLTREVLAEVAKLGGEYSGDLFVVGDEAVGDTLLRLAMAHVRYAALQTLCADISFYRGDRDAEGNFRKEANRAAKNARRFFTQAGRVYEATHAVADSALRTPLEAFFAESDTVESGLTILEIMAVDPPDSLQYVHAGAHYGFNFLAEKPASVIPSALDGFAWQRWTAHRFANDYKITQTPDLDSLLSLLLEGPMPGTLTGDPGHDGEPSLAVMAAAFQNLAELYLGVHPNWLQRRVEILPRPPQQWGRTAARIPISTGFIHLDFDFDNGAAYVSTSGLKSKLDVIFGYPLPTGGFVRTQFALSPDEPRVRIRMERDSENRVKLNVKED